MISYSYNGVQISNLAVVAIKIERRVGVRPIGLTDTGDFTTVLFTNELTAGQKAILDVLMVEPGIDLIPANTGNTTYIVDDFSDARATIQASMGATFDVYPTLTGYEVQFSKTLTTSEKNSLKGIFVNLLHLK